METESMLEANIRRIVHETQRGATLAYLTDRDREDITWLDGFDLTAYDHQSVHSPIVGSLSVREVRCAQAISNALERSNSA